MPERPNVLFFHVDNLGFGELSCYSGGPLRGATTERIDAFASEGLRLTNYCPESQCTPTRSALMTGRHAIRSGTHTVAIGTSAGSSFRSSSLRIATFASRELVSATASEAPTTSASGVIPTT